MRLVLGIDPGFASVGYALLRPGTEGFVLLKMGVVRTEKWKPSKKRPKATKPSASEDNVRRAQEIGSALLELLEGVDTICVEAMSFPRNASAAAKMAMFWGVLSTLALIRGLNVIQVSPQKIKIAVTGHNSAEKEEVQAALEKLFGAESVDLSGITDVPKSLREHPFDALGAAVTCADHPEIAKLLASEREPGE